MRNAAAHRRRHRRGSGDDPFGARPWIREGTRQTDAQDIPRVSDASAGPDPARTCMVAFDDLCCSDFSARSGDLSEADEHCFRQCRGLCPDLPVRPITCLIEAMTHRQFARLAAGAVSLLSSDDFICHAARLLLCHWCGQRAVHAKAASCAGGAVEQDRRSGGRRWRSPHRACQARSPCVFRAVMSKVVVCAPPGYCLITSLKPCFCSHGRCVQHCSAIRSVQGEPICFLERLQAASTAQ